MEAVRKIVQVDDGKVTLSLPASFQAKQVEVIVLPADMRNVPEANVEPARRHPSPKLKGTQVLGDLMTPAAPESDWEALK